MPYDENGFNYNGESILSLYDTTRNETLVKTSYFSKQGVDIATMITPAVFHDWHGRSSGNKTDGNYTGFGTTNLTFDNAFSVTASIKTKGYIYSANVYDRWDNNGFKCVQFTDPSNSVVYFYGAKYATDGSSTTATILTPKYPVSLLIVGGGGGGKIAYYAGYGDGGPGGGGGGAVVLGSFYPHSSLTSYSMSIGRGGDGQTSWTTDLAGYKAYDGGNTQFYANGYRDYHYFIQAMGGTHGTYMNEAGSDAEGSSAGASQSGTNINEFFYARNLKGTGYRLGQSTTTTGTDMAIHGLTVYRNKGGDSSVDVGYGWAGSGGGGAGGVGGQMNGGYNKHGGAGGAGLTLWGRVWAGGGGGGGDASQGQYFGNGANGGSEVDGFGDGGNSVGTFTGTTDGKDGSVTIRVDPAHYDVYGF